MSISELEYKTIKPDLFLSDYVESFLMVINHSENDKEIVILPDGIIGVIFSYSKTEPFNVMLYSFDSEAKQVTLASKEVIFAINFKLLAAEYILDINIVNLPNNELCLPNDFWDITLHGLNNFEYFIKKTSEKMLSLLDKKLDERKRKLFELIYSSNGSMTVKELSEQSFWSSRQINRYFKQNFGISLKTYCNIVRFRASFKQIKEGNLFPEKNFTDQAHFIKEIKKFSGVPPKELSKNKNDRFIQFSTLFMY